MDNHFTFEKLADMTYGEALCIMEDMKRDIRKVGNLSDLIVT